MGPMGRHQISESLTSPNAGRQSTSNSASAKNLCDTLAKITKADDFIIDYLLSLDMKGRPQRLFASKVQLQDESLTTLQDELAMEGGQIRMYSSGHLGVRDCLTLATVLLLAVLKYRLTPWLSNAWSSKNIYFIQRAKSLSRSELTRPFLKSGFRCGTPEPWQNPKEYSSQVSSTILFEVGVMLLEIVHGNSFDCLMTEKEKAGAADTDPEDRQMWRARAAWRLYKAFPAYMCLRSYKEVTERCLKNQFSDGMEKDLLEKPLRAAIYSKAIKPLLEDVARVI